MRYDDPAQIPDAFYQGVAPRGPVVLPGKYTLKLTAGGKTMTQPLVVVRDPRVKSPDSGIAQKFALTMEVYQDQDALHKAVNDIRAARTQITAAQKKLGSKSTAEGNTLIAQTMPIENTLMQTKIKGSEANLNYPGMLNEQIYNFEQLLEDADMPPTKEELSTYAALHTLLQAQLDAWAKLKSGAVAAFLAKAQTGKKG
jgi:hypothetical protein